MIQRPSGLGAFEFVAIAALRVAQLVRGCTPRVDGHHTTAVCAQREVAEGKVTQIGTALQAVPHLRAAQPEMARLADLSPHALDRLHR